MKLQKESMKLENILLQQEEESLSTKVYPIAKDLVKRFEKEIRPQYTPGFAFDVNPPSTKVWTRLDGSKYKEPGTIRSTDVVKDPKKMINDLWEWIKKQPGMKNLGKMTGEFSSDTPRTVYVYNNKVFFAFIEDKQAAKAIEFGSTSRFKNRAVWRQL